MPGDPPIGIPEWISYELHGYWVTYRNTGHVGRIGYHHRDGFWAVVLWEDGAEPRPRRPRDDQITFRTFSMEQLELLDREPIPWYDLESIERLRIYDEDNS